MKVPDVEGLATHNGPESCVVVGDHGCEALTGGGAGQVLSREIVENFGVPTSWDKAEGKTGRIGKARYDRTLRGRRP